MKNPILMSVFLMFMIATCVLAESDSADLKPGMTPDSPFYFLDTMFDGLQSPESLADEKAAEIVAMAQKNKTHLLEKARERYEKAMNKRANDMQGSEEDAEEVTRQASRHMQFFSGVNDKIPQEARQGIEEAMKNSARERENALNRLREKNPERAESVANETLTRILKNANEQAKAGLQRALNASGIRSDKEEGYAGTEDRRPDTPVAEDEVSGDSEQKEAPKDSAEKQDMQGQEDNFRLLVSDAPADIADFDRLDVKLAKTRIFSGEDNESGFEEKEINTTIDLTQLVGKVSTEVLSVELEPGVYTKIELYVESVEAKANNETADVMVPSEKLQIVKPFEIVDGEVTSFVFDINVVRKGQENRYNLLPVISESGVVGKDLSEDEVEEVENGSEEGNNSEEQTQCDENTCEQGYECVEGVCEIIQEGNNSEEQNRTQCDENTCEQGYECVEGECEVIQEGNNSEEQNRTQCDEENACEQGYECVEGECEVIQEGV